MRRTSLTPDQARQLAEIFRSRRTSRGLSMRQVAAATGFNVATIAQLEGATNLSPLPGTLRAIAEVLDLNVSDLYAVADWLPVGELPTLKPYLRVKYRDLDEQAIADLEAYAARLVKRHGGRGPIDGEDEQPETAKQDQLM
jgi:transcriptional regulator with XRE-family HTH domain